MQKKIPAQIEITCDACGLTRKVNENAQRSIPDFKLCCNLKLAQYGTDTLGNVVGDCTRTLELCDTCCQNMNVVIDHFVNANKTKKSKEN